MDEQYKPDKYLEYLNVIDKSAEEPEISIHDTEIARKEVLDQFTGKIKAMSDATENKFLLTFICLLMLALIGLQIYFLGYTWRLLLLLPFLVFIIIYRSRMKSEAKELRYLHSKIKTDGELKAITNSNLVYLRAGIDFKETRLDWVKKSFILFFPLLMVFGAELYSPGISTAYLIVSLILAYIISSIGWWWYFEREKVQYDTLRDEMRSTI